MDKDTDKSNKIIYAILGIIIAVVVIYAIYKIGASNDMLLDNKPSTDLNENDNQNINIYDELDEIKNNVTDIYETSQVEEEIASYTTTIYDQDENRVHNITLANTKLNNFIIKAGEEFSFNNTIGPMGGDMGYKEALGFDSNGNKIKIFGGGLCQISSTLYNTALIAGFEITERHPHSVRVAYVPKDKDATIVYGSLDLKFINNSGSDVKVISTNDNANVTVKLVKITTKTQNKV